MTRPVEQVAERFLSAIRSGDEQTLWDLFSEAAQVRILDIGDRVGIPGEVTGRMRIGTASDAERSRFLGDVLDGVRADLHGSDLNALTVEVIDSSDSAARVGLVQTMDTGSGFSLPPIPAAWLTLVSSGAAWLVDDVAVPK